MKAETILNILAENGATCRTNGCSNITRQWIFVTGLKLETLQGLFPRIQISVLDDHNLAFPVDTVELPVVTPKQAKKILADDWESVVNKQASDTAFGVHGQG